MINSSRGTPFTGYVSLSSATTSAQFSLFVNMGQTAYTLQPGDRLYIDQIQISTNDTTQRLVTVDTLGPTPTKLVSAYVVSTQPPFTESTAPGIGRSCVGIVPRAFAPAVTAGKTVECVIVGHIALDMPNAPYFPANTTGLGLWLRATNGVTTSSGNVSGWSDISGNGNSFSAAGAAQPAYNVAPMGGKPTVTFNGTTSVMNCVSNITMGLPSCMVAVLRKQAFNGGIEQVFTTQQLALIGIINPTPHDWGVYLNQNIQGQAMAVGTSYCLIGNQHAANNVDLIQNGNVSNQTNGTGTPSRTGTTIGADPTNVQFGSHDLAEVMLFNRDLTTTEIVNLRAYVSNFWGFAA